MELYQEMVDQHVMEWRRKFSGVQGRKGIVSLMGETSADLCLLEKGDTIVCTPNQVSAWNDFPTHLITNCRQ